MDKEQKEQDTFAYTYSSKQQEEIRRIRQKYLPKSEDKMDELRRLDRSATRKGTILSLTVGVVGCLLFGLGMACTLVWMDTMFIPGIVIGIVGIAAVAAANPVYAYVTKKERARLAPQILKLADELSKPE